MAELTTRIDLAKAEGEIKDAAIRALVMKEIKELRGEMNRIVMKVVGVVLIGILAVVGTSWMLGGEWKEHGFRIEALEELHGK